MELIRRSSNSALIKIVTALFAAFALVACSSTSGTSDAPITTNSAFEPKICTERFSVESELAVPGTIEGFDCYDKYDKIEYLYRESDDSDALEVSEGTWFTLPDARIYSYNGDGWFIVVNEKNKDEIVDSSPRLKGDFAERPEIGKGEEDSDDYNPETCSQFAGAIAYGYVFRHEGLPDGLSAEARNIIESSYSQLEKSKDLDIYSEDAPEVRIELGNRAGEIDMFCASGGEIFG